MNTKRKSPPPHGTNNRYQSRNYSCRCEKCKKAHRRYMYKYRRKPDYNSHKLDFERIYKTPYEWYVETLEKQKGKCAICKLPPRNKKLHTDHCHSTGRVRGLLCPRCNLLVGIVEGTTPVNFKMINKYLTKYEVAT